MLSRHDLENPPRVLCHRVTVCCVPFCAVLPPPPSCREELDRVVPRPTTHFVTYTSGHTSVGVIGDSLAWLNWTKEHLLRPAKRYVRGTPG